MSLNHKFFLIDNNEIDYTKYLDSHSNVNLPDDLVRYISDTLYWILTIKLLDSKNVASQELDMYGTIIIKNEGISILSEIVNAWIALFSQAPTTFHLIGYWTEDINDNGEVEFEGHYQTLEFDRDRILDNLKTLSNHAKQSLQGNFSILHIGI